MDWPVDVVIAAHRGRQKSLGSHHSRGICMSEYRNAPDRHWNWLIFSFRCKELSEKVTSLTNHLEKLDEHVEVWKAAVVFFKAISYNLLTLWAADAIA